MTTAIDSIDAALDAALDMTFPASDPVALSMPDAGDRRITEDQASPAIDGTTLSLPHRRGNSNVRDLQLINAGIHR